MSKSTRRGFLAFLGFGASAAITAKPRLPEAPKCECPVEAFRVTDSFLGQGEGITVHASRRCPIHAEYAKDGCGVYACDFPGCHNPRTRGLSKAAMNWARSHRNR